MTALVQTSQIVSSCTGLHLYSKQDFDIMNGIPEHLLSGSVLSASDRFAQFVCMTEFPSVMGSSSSLTAPEHLS
jgi:hypothetical protein